MSKRNWRGSLDPKTKAVIKAVEAQGWTVDCTANGHVRYTSPSGEVVIGNTAGRGVLNQHHSRTVKRLQKLGAEVAA